jgi:uncharacterized membrane protein YdjX (TVP38/TMEM64 family)
MSAMEGARVRQMPRIVLLVLLAIAVALATAWRFTPLHDLVDPGLLARHLHALARSPWAPAVVAVIYLGGNAVMFPNSVLNMAMILGLGTLPGLPYALFGSLLAALVGYVVGRRYGEGLVHRIDARSIERVSAMLHESGPLRIALLRLLPVAPYTVVNLAVGAARVRALSFAFGTFLGLLPGTLLVTAFGHQLRAALRDPSPREIALTIAVLIAAAAAGWGLQRLAHRRSGA